MDVPGKCQEITPEAVRLEEIKNSIDIVALES
jgi:hypothetical protein